ncbi:MAG TPA: undecaprenyl-diphosphate phosphatase [Caulobacteraceae bacterium]|nr:undecaprenyl-diphosphate phosphatase [Caulobacteraceae bacterium]
MAAACAGVDTGFIALGYGRVAFLGVVQGITELLPISSTAHMRIVPALLGWPDPGAAFSAAMQLAALAAVLSYFWGDIVALTRGSAGALARRQYDDHDLKLVIYILVATAPIVIGGLLLSPILNACDSPLRSIPAIGVACLAMAVLLGLAEVGARHARTMANAGFLDAILVGVAQIGALIPGVSRSGSTLTAALALGFKREEAARFAFLLGIPAIALAGVKELWELHKVHLGGHGWAILGVGVAIGAVSAFITIWGLMRFLERASTWPFVAYRAALGVILLGGAVMGFVH